MDDIAWELCLHNGIKSRRADASNCNFVFTFFSSEVCRQNQDIMFQCGKGSTKCVLLSWVCDGREDCQDGSDESSCSGITELYLLVKLACTMEFR
jgi:hypothetical protein